MDVFLTLLRLCYCVCVCVHTVRRREVCLQSRLQKRVTRKKVERLEHVREEGEGGEEERWGGEGGEEEGEGGELGEVGRRGC